MVDVVVVTMAVKRIPVRARGPATLPPSTVKPGPWPAPLATPGSQWGGWGGCAYGVVGDTSCTNSNRSR